MNHPNPLRRLGLIALSLLSILSAPFALGDSAATGTIGEPAVFSVSLGGGTEPLTYQWRKSTSISSTPAPIAGATGATYTILALTSGSAGAYSVVVSNSLGSTTSDFGVLTVQAAPPPPPSTVAPTFTTQPAPTLTVQNGGTLTLTAVATGTPTPTYQWFINTATVTNTAIPGATASTLSLPGVTSQYSGTYTCVATNSAGAKSSNPSNVTVITGAVPVNAKVGIKTGP